MKKNIKKFNNVMAGVVLGMGIIFILMNLAIYINGTNFAEKYGAASYDIGYFRAKTVVGGGGLTPQGEQRKPYPSFFKYFDENGGDLILKNDIFEEYDHMNKINFNYHESFKVLTAVLFTLTVAGFFITILNRYNYIGYILPNVFVLIIIFQGGMLNFWSFICAAGLLFSAFLVYKSRFVDYNESVIPFVKKKRLAYNSAE